MQAEANSSTFEPYIQETFRIYPPDGEAIETQLIEVKVLGADSDAVTTERIPFSILFKGPATPVLAQNTYHLEHAKLGNLDLFLVPIGPDESGGMRYEAVFT